MTKEETLKIMSMLEAYYGKPKSDSEMMANAWHLVLQNYDYKTAEKAVVEFAVTDTRDYAVFPTIGKFCEAVEKTKKMPWRILGKIRNGTNYDELSIIEKTVISQASYERAQAMDDVYLVDNSDKIIGYIELKLLDKPKV